MRVDEQRPFELHGPIEGLSLLDALENNELNGVCPELPGVYLWSRRISPTSQNLATQDAFTDWLDSELSRRQGIVTDDVKHMGAITWYVGGSKLRNEKKQALADAACTRENRKKIQGLLRSFDYHVTLYVGETDNICSRVKQHLTGASDFSARLAQYGYEWEIVGLRYALLPGWTVKQRQALERSLAILTLSPALSRAG
ncbi:hypothetical protein LRF89_12275 [Halorhodospira sp. 9621]|uniref:hypothetical protein n=1 Tax=Halorhodospira sp. 9621 TaxID=2899135 RepID=UPI001EE90462|nr:hypothetical protein [Halorhodospira sp. 9621]MCG5534211.1 hypothetical protein [Halorhodospira sp. 9621]